MRYVKIKSVKIEKTNESKYTGPGKYRAVFDFKNQKITRIFNERFFNNYDNAKRYFIGAISREYKLPFSDILSLMKIYDTWEIVCVKRSTSKHFRDVD